MAEITVKDIQVGTRGLTGQTSSNFRSQSAVADATQKLANGIEDVAKVGIGIADKMQINFNERKTNEAELKYREGKQEILRGENGLSFRRGRDSEGMTEEASQALSELSKKISEGLPNSLVNTDFLNETNKDIANTINVMSGVENNELEAVHQSDAMALHDDTVADLISMQPSEFINFFPEGPLTVAMNKSRDYLGAGLPRASDKEIENLIETEYAQAAQAAVYSLMENGAGINHDTAVEIQALWGKHWSLPEQRAVREHIRDRLQRDGWDR